jgi:uncharacterized membrane protein YkoI
MKRQFIYSATALAMIGMASGVVIAAPALPTSANSPHFSGHRLAGSAHVPLVDAQAIALKARPGVITDQELEKEHGGSGLRYSFDVRSAGVTYEVGVDAKDGKVLENGQDGKNPD